MALGASGSFIFQRCHVVNTGTKPVVTSASVATMKLVPMRTSERRSDGLDGHILD
jgi:hypothetical protein